MFRWYTNYFKYNLRDKLGISEIIDIFSCDDIISSHVRISYCFYEIVTTWYTTDFYIIIDHIFGLISHGMSCVIIYEAYDLSRSFIVAVENEACRICSKNINLVPNYMYTSFQRNVEDCILKLDCIWLCIWLVMQIQSNLGLHYILPRDYQGKKVNPPYRSSN